MRVTPIFRPLVHRAIDTRVDNDVQSALRAISTVGNQFVVNDSLWYAVNDRGKVTPCVVNQADFISGSFQKELRTRGWRPEKVLDGQRIDAFLEFQVPTPLPAIGVDDGDAVAFFRDYLSTSDGANALAEGEPKPEVFARLYDSFVRRSSIAAPESIDKSLHKHLKPITRTSECRDQMIGYCIQQRQIDPNNRMLAIALDDHHLHSAPCRASSQRIPLRLDFSPAEPRNRNTGTWISPCSNFSLRDESRSGSYLLCKRRRSR